MWNWIDGALSATFLDNVPGRESVYSNSVDHYTSQARHQLKPLKQIALL